MFLQYLIFMEYSWKLPDASGKLPEDLSFLPKLLETFFQLPHTFFQLPGTKQYPSVEGKEVPWADASRSPVGTLTDEEP